VTKPRSEVVEQLRADAERHGAMTTGHFRVSVIEANAKISHRDFGRRAEAIQYADDAAAESDDNPPIACVFDQKFRLIHQGGKH
jgi:hypothetical protein